MGRYKAWDGGLLLEHAVPFKGLMTHASKVAFFLSCS